MQSAADCRGVRLELLEFEGEAHMQQSKAAYAKLRAVFIAVMGLAFAWSASAAHAADLPATVKAVIAYDTNGSMPAKKYRIAYLTECVDNPYCLARLAGLKDAAKKYGFEFKIFDANFNPATQAKVVENAVTEGFDGYLFGPAAAQPGCGLWKRLLQPTGKPVVSIDIAMCGDPDYTPGLAATFTMQGPAHFADSVNNAFKSCTSPCEVAAVGGFVGSDLFTYWENALKEGVKKYPNVKLVVDEPANFDPRIALKKIQDALLAHPNISVVVSSWDDMSRGVEQAIVAAGKKPGTDVRIYSGGATQLGVDKVKAGIFNATTAYLPYEESYYGAVALLMAMDGKPVNGHIDEALLPKILDTTGTIIIDKSDVEKYHPNY
jgi:galactofuranose transport system substrate-binding protein